MLLGRFHTIYLRLLLSRIVIPIVVATLKLGLLHGFIGHLSEPGVLDHLPQSHALFRLLN